MPGLGLLNTRRIAFELSYKKSYSSNEKFADGEKSAKNIAIFEVKEQNNLRHPKRCMRCDDWDGLYSPGVFLEHVYCPILSQGYVKVWALKMEQTPKHQMTILVPEQTLPRHNQETYFQGKRDPFQARSN